MKNKRIGVCGLLVLGMILTGCSQPTIPDSGINTPIVSDPMNKTDSNIGDEEVQHKTITYGFKFTEENINYENGKLVLTPILKGANESTTAGFLVFVDGILQEYSVSDSLNKTYMSTFDTIPDGEEKIKLTVDAVVDENFDEHIVSVCSMLCPSFLPTAEHPRFGFYHSILSAKPITISVDRVNADTKKTKTVSVENSVLTKAQKDKYSQGEDENNNPIISVFELVQQNHVKSDRYVLDNGQSSLDLSFCACTSEPYTTKYRVSFYKNHLPCKFNGDNDFLEMVMEGGKISEKEVTLEDVKLGDVVYCIATPLGDDITCGVYKSKSCLVVGSNSSSVQNETPNLQQNENKLGIELSNSKPVFSADNTIYFVNSTGFSPDTQSGILLCSSKNGKDVDKAIEIGTATPKKHSEYISLLCSEGNDVLAKLYDKELNEIKSVKLNDILGENTMLEEISLNVDFDSNKIVYVSDFGKLCSCDWNLGNRKVLMNLPCSEEPDASAFNAVCISGEIIAFTANGNSGGRNQDYYGICNLDGKYEIYRKDNIDIPQANDAYIVWSDRHVALGSLPSGKIEIYKDGRFESINAVEQDESQYAFLGENSVLTFSGSGNVLRKYKYGKASEFPLEQGEHGVTAVEFGGKIFVESYGENNKNKTYSIEVD